MNNPTHKSEKRGLARISAVRNACLSPLFASRRQASRNACLSPLFASRRQTSRNACLSPLFAPNRPTSSTRGFTLAEMLVATAVVLVLMSGLTMLLSGSIRTVRTAALQGDAVDRANGAIASLKSDLLAGFNARHTGNDFSFYGTPIGMTFIGSVRNRSENSQTDEATLMQNTDLRVARITYVLYHDANSFEMFPEAVNGQDYYTHRLLRYVEPNVADLETFPIPFDAVVEDQPSIAGFIDREWNDFITAYPNDYSDEYQKKFRQVKTCELWIRMLAGGDDNGAPNAWAAPAIYLGRDEIDVTMFILTDHVATEVPPGLYEADPFAGTALFDYNYARPDAGRTPANPWWNNAQSLNCMGNGDVYCIDPSLPEVVSCNFWLMFDAPYAGAAQYQRLFSVQINVPAGYKRQPAISGYVRNAAGLGVPGVVFTARSPQEAIIDLGVNIETDGSGYYCVSVPYGWSGNLQPSRDTNEEKRSYVNVTTNITGQDYEVQ